MNNKVLLILIATFQTSCIRGLEDTCDAKSGKDCQMSESTESSENDDSMGQYICSSKKETSFPETLEGFGYKFNAEGQMRNLETGEPFKFEVKEGDRVYNQKHYEALGEVITEYVYKLLEEEVKLKKHFVPVDAEENEDKSFFFMSDDALTCDKLMILIHGSGVVRAGQWARRLIINDDLSCGTMLPYIKRASEEGYGVLITNGNENYVRKNKKRTTIRGSESPESHFVYVCEHFISKAAAQKIVVVAHSYGGVVIVEGLQQCKGLQEKVKAVAFTDSVHSLVHQKANRKFIKWMRKNSRNWVSSDRPLDTPIQSLYKGADCDLVSAGTVRHELTSHFAFDSVFKFFDEKIKLPPNTGSDVSEDSEQEGDASSQNNMDSAEDPEKTSANNMDASVDPDEKPSENKKDSGADDVDANSQTKGDNPQSQPDDSQMETDI